MSSILPHLSFEAHRGGGRIWNLGKFPSFVMGSFALSEHHHVDDVAAFSVRSASCLGEVQGNRFLSQKGV